MNSFPAARLNQWGTAVLGKFQPGLAIDCWTLVPDIWKRWRRGREAGQFVIRDGTLEIVHGRQRSPSTSLYIADLFLPSDNQAPATGFLILLHDAWEWPKLILLVGSPTGFGEYRWCAICPATLQPVQMLYFDAGTQLFVSDKAIGKPAPVSVQRANKAKIENRKYLDKYGSNSDANSGDLKNGRNSVLLEAESNILFDVLFALNGLPSPIFNSGALYQRSLGSTDMRPGPGSD
jgi:hypothetical protein